jgi:carbamoyl-phosphate synthase large subunit
MATILISSAGRRVELIGCFRASARALGIELEVLATDLEPALSAACQRADRAFATPRCTAPECAERLLEICAAHAVDLLIPTIDTELEPLARAAPRLLAAGTAVSVSAPGLLALSRDNLLTADLRLLLILSVPRSGWVVVGLADPVRWRGALFVRPRGGSSSIGIHEVASPGPQLCTVMLGSMRNAAVWSS